MNILAEKGSRRALKRRAGTFSTWSLIDLIEYIVANYHRPAKRDIAMIYDLAHVVAYKHSDRHPQLRALLEALFLSFDNMLLHLRMEESAFFPIIEQLLKAHLHGHPGVTTIPVDIYEIAETITKDHNGIVNDLEVFRAITRSYTSPDDDVFLLKYLYQKMKEFDMEMSFCVQLENGVLLPKAIALINEMKKKGKTPRPFWKERI